MQGSGDIVVHHSEFWQMPSEDWSLSDMSIHQGREKVQLRFAYPARALNAALLINLWGKPVLGDEFESHFIPINPKKLGVYIAR